MALPGDSLSDMTALRGLSHQPAQLNERFLDPGPLFRACLAEMPTSRGQALHLRLVNLPLRSEIGLIQGQQKRD